MKLEKLEDLIREKIPFSKTDSRGFNVLKCQCCHDYKIRAGFRFEAGTIFFNCWNCSTSGSYTEFEGTITRKFRSILNAHGIEDTEISAVVNSAFFFKKQKEESEAGCDMITLSNLTKINTTTPAVKLPPKSILLGSTSEFLDYQTKLVAYLEKRKIDLNKYRFYFSLEPRFIDRVIIPFYRNSQVIFWQARHISDAEKKRYDNAPVSREAILFNINQLYVLSQAPLFITEGVFDAMIVNGVALLGSKLNDAKIELLSKSNRRLIFVIDKDKNGRALAQEVLKRGWEITFAPEGANDINKSAQRFGLSWTVYSLMNGIPKNNDEAQLAINRNCV